MRLLPLLLLLLRGATGAVQPNGVPIDYAQGGTPGPYALPSSGPHPSLLERQLLQWTNAARVATDEFATKYMAGVGGSANAFKDGSGNPYPKVDPLFWQVRLNEVARYQVRNERESAPLLRLPSVRLSSLSLVSLVSSFL
jgi:hypothetical protein